MENSYHEIFLAESQEYLNTISQCLVKIEESPHDLESLNEIFRAIHTLKGMSATMGFEKLTQLSHHMEDLLDALRSQKIKANSEIIDTLFSCLDILEALIEGVKAKKKSSVDINPSLEALQKFFAPAVKTDEFTELSLEAAEFSDSEYTLFKEKKAQGKEVYKIKINLNKDCAMKQVRAFLVLTNLERVGEVLKYIPSVEDLKEGRFGFSFIVVLVTKENIEAVQNGLLSITEVSSVEIKSLVESLEKQAAPRAALPSYIKKIQSMRIPVERLDKIMNLMGELAIAKIRLLQIVGNEKYKPLEEVAFAVDRLITALQDEVMQTRLLPISYVLDTFPRITRDLAKGQNKQIEFEIIGSEIELDRTILDELGDPLIHLLRNAIDHGIESPAKRKQLKKNQKGKIFIKVVRQKGHISIEVSDDGRGIDFESVAQSAAQKGMISKEEAVALSKNKSGMLNLLTSPGFSTSDKVSEISGRGVGLDVVKLKMEALGGGLDFDSIPEEGTSFFLTLPLTLAIIKAMLVRVRSEIFAVPLMSIRETLKIEEDEIKLIKSFEVIRLREEIIPIIRLDHKLELMDLKINLKDEQEQEEKLSIVIIEYGEKSVGLMVNQVLGEQDIVVKPLGSMVKRIRGIAGATILGDGRVALILDIMTLM
ncbi:MAG: chemotaxis protein CheA [Candidatus Omnitrophica bacterium]|nr:chemotaxis protein CheA [Candidatus Omnitrophota bacterium]